MPDDFKNVRENADIAVDFFDHQADERDMEFLPVKNATCITMHCSGYIASCLADETCRTKMLCDSVCPVGDTTCQFKCSESYKSSRFDKLSKCLYVDHECLDPINNAEAETQQSEPTETVESEVNGPVATATSIFRFLQ